MAPDYIGAAPEPRQRPDARLQAPAEAPGTQAGTRPHGHPSSERVRRFAVLIGELGYRLWDALTVLVVGFIWERTMWSHGGSWHVAQLALLVLIAPMTSIAFSVHGLYRPGTGFHLGSTTGAWWQAFGLWLVGVMLITLLADMAFPGAAAYGVLTDGWFQPKPLALFFCGGLAGLVAGRFVLSQLFWRVGIVQLVRPRTCIVGAGPNGEQLAEYLKAQRDPGINLVGFFDDRQSRLPSVVAGLPVLGRIEELIEMIEANRIDAVLLALPWSETVRIEEIVRRVAVMPVSVGLAPDMVGFQFPNRAVRSVGGLPVLQVCEQRLSHWATALKHCEDVVLSSLMLLLLAPLMLAIAVAIKLDSPGPVLFSQRRYGMGNALIHVRKFRTMHAHMTDVDCAQQTVREDPRLTRVGAFLRRYSLDELPQLLNVLAGNMSIVGPRPHALETKAEGQLFEDAVSTYMARHRVKPGITGWAQVNGWRGETDTLEKIVRRVEHDLYYIGNWSLALDIMIILRTAKIVFREFIRNTLSYNGLFETPLLARHLRDPYFDRFRFLFRLKFT